MKQVPKKAIQHKWNQEEEKKIKGPKNDTGPRKYMTKNKIEI